MAYITLGTGRLWSSRSKKNRNLSILGDYPDSYVEGLP